MGNDEQADPVPDDNAVSRELRLGKILAECSDRLNEGEPLDIQKIKRENLDLEPELGIALAGLCGVGS